VYGALAHGGAVESARGPILDPYQVDDLHRDFEAARDAAGDGPASPLGFSRYGLERAGATRHAFGHAGLGQMFAFADPEDGLGVAVLVNQISPEPVAADAALACLLAELGAGRRIV
jgi:CubicO group peptidase (beta-lactamase class C family)